MSFLTTTQTLITRHPLPPSIPLTHAISTLQNHSILLRLDPNRVKYSKVAAPPPASSSSQKKQDSATKNPETSSAEETTYYTITNKLPGALGLGKEINYSASLRNTAEGVNWDIQASMGIVQKSVWKIVVEEYKENEEVKQRCVLVEEMEITGNRLLVGIVKDRKSVV